MKTLKNKLKKSKKDSYELLTIKEINKKVKEPISIKDKEKEKEIEYNLVLILKSLNNNICNPLNLMSSIETLKNELNFLDIETYLNQFRSKPYYKYKIYPLLEFLKELFLKSKKQKGFLHIVKDMNIIITEENKITDRQIDRLNYMLIFQYEKLLLLDNEIYDIFIYLKDIFPYLKHDYKYLLEYYLLIELHTFLLLNKQKIKDTSKLNNSEKKKNVSITKILFDIIYKTNNTFLIELAFMAFCQNYLHFRDNSFVFVPVNKWVFLILKLLSDEIKIEFDDSKDKDYYNLSKLLDSKYKAGENERNQKREKSPENIRKSILSAKEMTNIQRISIPPNLKLNEKSENASEYLEDKTYETYPDDIGLPRGISENFIINLYKYDQSEKENIKNKKENYNNNQKLEIIQGALIIADKIIKFDYSGKEYADYDEKYFCVRLLNVIMKLYLKINDFHIIKRCLSCFGSILLKYPYCIIDYIPKIIIRLSENALSGKTENLVNQLNYFFQNCSTIFQKAYETNNKELVRIINKITKDSLMMRAIVLLNPFIFKLNIIKPNVSKSFHEKINSNIQTLKTNYFIFCSSLVYNNLILNNYMLTIYIEVIIIYFVEKSTQDMIRKYMIKIITKIYRDKLLTRILNFLLVDEKGNLKLKTLFYILRYISSDKYNKNNLPFLIKFLEKNNKINTSSSSKILQFLSKHIINKETKFYFVDFYKDKNLTSSPKSELNNDENEYVEIYDTLNPKTNIKIFTYIMKIFFHCISEAKEFDDISHIHKILSMIFVNMATLEQNNILKLFEYLSDYLNNLAQKITVEGHKIWQNYFKQYLEIINYANSYINIKNNYFKDENIDKKYIESLINSYNKIILNLFKLIPNNLSSKEYEILNMIPIIYSHLLTLDNLTRINNKEKKEISDNDENENKTPNELLNILKNYLATNKLKTQTTIYSCNISLFYFFYYIKNISKKEFFKTIYNIIIKLLNIDEFKYENTFINAANYILVKLCVKILYEEKEYIAQGEVDTSSYDKKYQLIDKLHGLIKNNINDDKISIINSINPDDSLREDNCNLVEQSLERRIELINKYINFTPNSNYININIDKNNNLDEIKDIKIEKYKETKDIISCRYQKWLIFIEMLSNSKTKKNESNDINDNIDFLLNSSFSFSENKPIHFISIIKSTELEKKDIKFFSNFLAILGNIIINGNEIVLKNENIFENNIFKFDKMMHGVVFVLTKQYFEQLDAHFSCNFIVFIKPLNFKGLYLIKIEKKSDFKMKNNSAFKLLTQIDNDFNKMFSDFIMLDTSNQQQIYYFYNLIEMIFNYSFLEEQINT